MAKNATTWAEQGYGELSNDAVGFSLLLETGDVLLLETGDELLLEDSTYTAKALTTYTEETKTTTGWYDQGFGEFETDLSDTRVTESGDTRVTESGDTRVTESGDMTGKASTAWSSNDG